MRVSPLFIALAATTSLACSNETGPDPKTLKSIIITGATSPVILGAVPTLQLTAEGRDQDNNPFPAQFIWNTSDASKATVSVSGLVTIIAVGTVTIRAESQGISGSVSIEITPPPQAQAVGAVVLDDVTNQGKASDFEVSFDRVVDETRVREYRIMMVKSAKAPGFRLSDADAMAPARFLAVARTGQNVKVTLAVGAVDTDGDAIVEGTMYSAFVLSVADGVNARDNALSQPSNAFEAAQTTVKITFVGDMGVVISDGTRSVIIDAIPLDFSVVIGQITVTWIPAAPGLVTAITNGTPPYGNIPVALVTHDHLDHWAIASSGTFLARHSEATLLAPPQAASNFPGNTRVTALNPALFESREVTVGGIRIRALRMLHFNNFGLDFSGVENLAFLVDIGGKRILHLGDADYTSQNFAPFDLTDAAVDVVIVPAATVKVIGANINLVRTLIAPGNILAAHLEASMTERHVRDIWGEDVAVFSRSLQFVRY